MFLERKVANGCAKEMYSLPTSEEGSRKWPQKHEVADTLPRTGHGLAPRNPKAAERCAAQSNLNKLHVRENKFELQTISQSTNRVSDCLIRSVPYWGLCSFVFSAGLSASKLLRNALMPPRASLREGQPETPDDLNRQRTPRQAAALAF